MFYKCLFLFLIVCIITGIATFAGSVIGHSFGQQGLLGGAIIGGIAGIFLSCSIVRKIKKLQPVNFISTFIGGIIGYAVSVLIAINFLHSPLITIGSMVLQD